MKTKLEIVRHRVMSSDKFTVSDTGSVYYFDTFLICKTFNDVPSYVKDNATGVILYEFKDNSSLEYIIEDKILLIKNKFFGGYNTKHMG